jgi:hypothetical protein
MAYSDPYTLRAKQARLDNLNNLSHKEIELKVKNHIDRFPNGTFSKQEIIQTMQVLVSTATKGRDLNFNNILSRDVFLNFVNFVKFVKSFLSKEPSRQSIHEKEAERFLRMSFCNVIRLPRTGQGALYLYENNGNIKVVDGKYVKNNKIKSGLSKSIDFSFDHLDVSYYALHKYTKEGGGNQDNQLMDAENFMCKANRIKNYECRFVAILDGEYYQDKIPDLREKYPNVCISDIEPLKSELDKYCQNSGSQNKSLSAAELLFDEYYKGAMTKKSS